jgi:CheY-like chemotaxis protein
MPKQILVVEDDPDNLRVLATVLSLDGYAVDTVSDGLEALDALADRKADLVLLDLKMPRLDGWETIRRMKADARLQTIPVVAITALALRGDEERARQAGCDDYLAKPCAPRKLRETVRRWIGAPD